MMWTRLACLHVLIMSLVVAHVNMAAKTVSNRTTFNESLRPMVQMNESIVTQLKRHFILLLIYSRNVALNQTQLQPDMPIPPQGMPVSLIAFLTCITAATLCFALVVIVLRQKRNMCFHPRTMARRRTSRKRLGKRHGKFRHALIQLKRMKPQHQCQAMKMANNGFIRQMCNHVKKLRHAKLSAKQVKALKRHRGKLRTLANSKVSITRKRQLLSQRGGFLSMLAPVLMSAIGPAIRSMASGAKMIANQIMHQ